MNLLSNSCQQTGKSQKTEKIGPPTNPTTAPLQKFLLLLWFNLSVGEHSSVY